MRLLVRQSLSLLEAMCDEQLPGFCSAHWVIFNTAICASAGGQETEQGELDDRERVDRLYEDYMWVDFVG
jgi:transcriptional activator protein UGA3